MLIFYKTTNSFPVASPEKHSGDDVTLNDVILFVKMKICHNLQVFAKFRVATNVKSEK